MSDIFGGFVCLFNWLLIYAPESLIFPPLSHSRGREDKRPWERSCDSPSGVLIVLLEGGSSLLSY